MMSTQAKTLPARYYTDADVFRREMETFFCGMWVCAGRSEQIANPGDFFVREVAGESIIVTRDASGAIHAFFNVCRHRGTQVCSEAEGKFAGRIQCPYHGWTYGLDGKLLGAPHMEEGNFRREEYPLHSAHVDEWAGHIFLNLASRAQPLGEQLGDLPKKFAPWRMEKLRMHKRMVYDVQANWKLIVLNYNECLHCPVLHPALHRITDYLSGDNDTPDSGYIGGFMEFRGRAQTMSVDGERRRAYLPGLSERQRKQVLYYAVYPNLLLSLHPDYVMAHMLWPQAIDRTQVVCEWHFHPAEMAKPDFQADDVVEFWNTTNLEDWGICELGQKGLRSRAYEPGPYSPREGLLQAFDQMILKHERENGKR
jgi:phenylpropionate dioxygenase-like ring-hydroxylating dioxygenase large terminal subunit